MAAAGLVAVTSVAGMPAVSCSLRSSNRSSISSSVTPLRKAFGLQSSGMGRITCRKVNVPTSTSEKVVRHKVTFHTPTVKKVVKVDGYTYLLHAAEKAGLDLPSNCRAGNCGTCAGKLRSGWVHQSEGRHLDDKQLSAGFVLTCVAYATADLEIDTHKKEDLNSSLEGRKDEEQVRRKKEEEEEEISSKRRWLLTRLILRILTVLRI